MRKAARQAPALLALLAALLAPSSGAAKALDVVATVPDLADMARIIGGGKAKVASLATGKEDLHAVPARPSFLPKLNRADLLIALGLEAEHAWLPALVAESRNPRIREGGEGYVDASRGIQVVGVPSRLDRSEGEQHPRGNPHYNIDPSSGPVMARNVAEALIKADPGSEAVLRGNLEAYLGRLEALQKDLRERGRRLRGLKVAEYHPDIAYFIRFYGMETVGSIEPKPGVPPAAGHLARLARDAKRAGVRLVIHNQSQDSRLPGKLAREIGAARVEIANAVGAKEGIGTWEDLQRYNLAALLEALPPEGAP